MMKVLGWSVLVLALAGCSADPPDERPAPTSSPRPTEAPRPDRALQWAEVDPCALAVPDDLRGSANTVGLAHTDGPTRYCVWADRVTYPRLSIGVVGGASPLGQVYRDNARWQRFRPVEVRGLPAVELANNPDGAGLCSVRVGSADGGLEVTAGADEGHAGEAQCPRALAVADLVVGGRSAPR